MKVLGVVLLCMVMGAWESGAGTFLVTTTPSQDESITEHASLSQKRDNDVVQEICMQGIESLSQAQQSSQIKNILKALPQLDPNDKEVIDRLRTVKP